MLTRCKEDTCKIMNYMRLLVKPEKTISKHTILRFYFLIFDLSVAIQIYLIYYHNLKASRTQIKQVF